MVVNKSGERIQKMFGEIAPRYDLMNHVLSLGIDHYWRWRTVRALPLKSELPILDVCTGTGDLAIAYWKRGQGKLPVIGCDFTPEMLDIAREKTVKLLKSSSKTEPLADLTFQQADTMELPFESNRFQIVSVAFGLRNVSDTNKGLDEMIRVCHPGGHVAILEFSQPRIPILGSLYGWYFRNILPRLGQFFARNKSSAYDYLPQSVAEFPQGKEMAQIMTARGLSNVKYHTLTFGVATLYLGQKSVAT
jgi:demethylmenaquinone methyltransferase/2-methoxy-6-polyprenyl-1,4-benzoquinol methylase